MKSTLEISGVVSVQIQEIMQNRVDECRLALRTFEPHIAIHETRKELKKIRALARLARASVPKQTYKKTNAYFRDVARLLSDARDTSALLDVVLTLRKQVEQSDLQSLLDQVANHLMAKKAAVTRYEINRDNLLHHTLESLEAAEDYINTFETEQQGFQAIAGGINKVYTRGRKMTELTLKNPNAELFHEWRKRVKYLRYQIDAISNSWPAMMSVWEDELHKLTDALGAEHDLFVLHETILESKLKNEANWQILFEFIATQRRLHQSEAQSLGNKLYHWKPKQFVRWLENSWETKVESSQVNRGNLIEV